MRFPVLLLMFLVFVMFSYRVQGSKLQQTGQPAAKPELVDIQEQILGLHWSDDSRFIKYSIQISGNPNLYESTFYPEAKTRFRDSWPDPSLKRVPTEEELNKWEVDLRFPQFISPNSRYVAYISKRNGDYIVLDRLNGEQVDLAFGDNSIGNVIIWSNMSQSFYFYEAQTGEASSFYYNFSQNLSKIKHFQLGELFKSSTLLFYTNYPSLGAISPQNNYILGSNIPIESGGELVVIKVGDTPIVKTISGITSTDVISATYLPWDDNNIVIVTHSNIVKYNLDNGTSVVSSYLLEGTPIEAAFSPDGRFLTYTVYNSDENSSLYYLYVVDMNKIFENPQVIPTPKALQPVQLAFSCFDAIQERFMWNIYNPNAEDLPVVWVNQATVIRGGRIALAKTSMSIYSQKVFENGDILRIFVNGIFQTQAATSNVICS